MRAKPVAMMPPRSLEKVGAAVWHYFRTTRRAGKHHKAAGFAGGTVLDCSASRNIDPVPRTSHRVVTTVLSNPTLLGRRRIRPLTLAIGYNLR